MSKRSRRGPSPETAAKISAALRGRKRPPFSAEWRANISRSHIGIVKSPETRAKLSRSLMGHPVPPSVREKIGNANRGRIHTKETRERLAQVSASRVWSLESREKIAASKRGVKRPPFSADWLKHLGESQRRSWQNPVRRQRTIQAQVAGNLREPTYPEEVGFAFLVSLDSRWEYNGGGDASVVIDGFVPDYVHREGRMVANEDGVAWHNSRLPKMADRDARRAEAYARNGWRAFTFSDEEILADDVSPLVERYNALVGVL